MGNYLRQLKLSNCFKLELVSNTTVYYIYTVKLNKREMILITKHLKEIPYEELNTFIGGKRKNRWSCLSGIGRDSSLASSYGLLGRLGGAALGIKNYC